MEVLKSFFILSSGENLKIFGKFFWQRNGEVISEIEFGSINFDKNRDINRQKSPHVQ